MPIPQFRNIILPFLESLADGKEHSMKEVESGLAKKFNLSQEELDQATPSGRMTVFENRTGWSKTYLKKAGLVEAPRKAFFKITKLGLAVLAKKPEIIDTKFLSQFASFKEFQDGDEDSVQEKSETSENTPEEIMQAGYQRIIKKLKDDLLDNLKSQSPRFFEQAVIDLLVGMGYGGSRKDAGQAIGKPGDEGIDGVIKEDKLGLDLIYVQAKRWNSTVGRPEVQSFVGALSVKFVKRGILITTSNFSREAVEFASKSGIILIDGSQLAQLMIEHNIGVSVMEKYEIKKIDSDYFEAEN